jgi:carbamoyl-phosphate synthase large subunit
MSLTVLIPGAGGAAAVSTIKSLRLAGFRGRIVSTDANPLSAGFALSDSFRVVPKASDPAFYATVSQLIIDEHIDIVFPTSGFDIYTYGRHKADLEQRGIVVAMSDLDAMTTCADKWQFYLKTDGVFPLPQTSRELTTWSVFPCFVKPALGKGSRDAYRCYDRTELSFYAARVRDLIVQEYLPGEEYTVDVLSDLEGTPLLAVPRVRLETKEGISTKGTVLKDDELGSLCLEMARHLGLKGPTCMQLKRDHTGALKFLEVNPRIGGGMMFTTLAGVNIPGLLLELISGAAITVPAWQEVTVLRYYEEVVLDAQADAGAAARARVTSGSTGHEDIP